MRKHHKPKDFSTRAGTTMTVLAWVIFLAFLFSTFDYFIALRSNPNQNVATLTEGQQKQIRLQRNAYGHYITTGNINGNKVTFLLDTGASDVAIPESIAIEMGLKKGRPITVKTANGNTMAYRTHLDSVAIGEIALYNLNATVLVNMTGNEILLGMNFLKHFEIIQKGQFLTIKQ